MTTQEKKFADEYVMLFFHRPASTVDMAVDAARYADYEVPDDSNKAWQFGKSLLAKNSIKEYVEAEIDSFRVKLSGSQRRNLWNLISNMTIGNPDDGNFSAIIPH